MDRILLALSELDKWKARREKAVSERNIKETDHQIAYYEALLRDMKRELHPQGLRALLRHI